MILTSAAHTFSVVQILIHKTSVDSKWYSAKDEAFRSLHLEHNVSRKTFYLIQLQTLAIRTASKYVVKKNATRSVYAGSEF
jgi:hypothetical protein